MVQKTRMPSPAEALKGRAEKMSVPAKHHVLDATIEGPYPPGTQKAIFGLGCFWGAERKFWEAPGVYATAVGYAAGLTPNPTYEEVCSGYTGHNEVVMVWFDPKQTSYEALLKVFWESHDPTQGMRQGNDVGTQYRSAVFYLTDAQKQETEAYIAQLGAAHAYKQPIVTQVAKLKEFYRAEDYHQNYAELHPDQPYIAINDAPKVVNLKKSFPQLYTDKLASHE